MKMLLLLSALASPAANAAVVQLALGQNASLNRGDVAVVSAGGLTSAVTCASNVAPGPEERIFQGEYTVNLGGIIPMDCRLESTTPESKSMRHAAVADGQRKCLNFGFSQCTADEASYTMETFAWGTGRDIGCRVTVAVHGIRQN
jgi:hypothetical protein